MRALFSPEIVQDEALQRLKGLSSAETTYGHLRAGESWGGGGGGWWGGGVGYHSSDRKRFD